MKDEKITAAKAFRFLSPLVLLSIFSLFAVIYCQLGLKESKGWSMIGVIVFLPILFISLLLDLLIKFIIKENTTLLWIIEMIIVLIGGIIYYNRFL